MEMNLNDVYRAFEPELQKLALKDQLVNNGKKRWNGIVMNNLDPSQLGRCQIMIYGYYDNITNTIDLPWAIPETTYLGSTVGQIIVPEKYSIVRGYFDNDDEMKPVYYGMVSNIVTQPNASNAIATAAVYKASATAGLVNAAGSSLLPKNFLKYTDFNIDYPYTMVLFSTDKGDVLTFNRKTGVMKFSHSNGTTFTISSLGDIKLDNTLTGKGKMNITIAGDCSITTLKNVSITALKDISINSTAGNVYLGRNGKAGQLVATLQVCPVTGVPLNGLNTNVRA